jgi:hypothetical protein
VEAQLEVVAAAERRDAPVGALGLKAPNDVPSFINVRPAGDPECCADLCRRVCLWLWCLDDTNVNTCVSA